MDITNILLPMDFSKFNSAALDYASRLASETGATLHIVHADEMEQLADAMAKSGHPYPSPWDDKGSRKAHVKLHKIVPTIQGVKYRHHYLKGTPTGEILSFAERKGVDLIVMASHGRTGLARLLMGSTAEGVMRRAQCPVLIVKQRATSGTSEDQHDVNAVPK
jgi:universal stress protein A